MIPRRFCQVRHFSTPPKFYAKVDSLDDIANRVIFKNADFLAINKPYGVAVHGGPRVKFDLSVHMHKLRFGNRLLPELVHRLDSCTTGVLVMSRTGEAARLGMRWFKQKKIKKIYQCLTLGVPKETEGVIDVPLKVGMSDPDYNDDRRYILEANIGSVYGVQAITKYKVLETFEGPNGTFSLLQLEPVTGKRHQLRIHCCDVLRCPIVGDHIRTMHKLYTATHLKGLRAKRAHLPLVRMHLHACEVQLPADEERGITEPTRISAPLPEHMTSTLQYLRGTEKWYDPQAPLVDYTAGRTDIQKDKRSALARKVIRDRNIPPDYEDIQKQRREARATETTRSVSKND